MAADLSIWVAPDSVTEIYEYPKQNNSAACNDGGTQWR